jgi:hypothetical protein
MKKRSNKKFNITSVLAAAGGGFVMESGLKMAAGANGGNNFVNNHWMDVKGYGGAVLGSALVYFFPNHELFTPAGYGILGSAGAALSNKLHFGTQQAQSQTEVVNGTTSKKLMRLPAHKLDVLKAVKNISKRPGASRAIMPGAGAAPAGQRPNVAAPARPFVNAFPAYGQLAMAELVDC